MHNKIPAFSVELQKAAWRNQKQQQDFVIFCRCMQTTRLAKLKSTLWYDCKITNGNSGETIVDSEEKQILFSVSVFNLSTVI